MGPKNVGLGPPMLWGLQVTLEQGYVWLGQDWGGGGGTGTSPTKPRAEAARPDLLSE